MKSYSRPRDLMNRVKRLVRKVRIAKRSLAAGPEPESPLDPYAYVGAPKKPRPSAGSAAAAVELE